MSNKKIRALRPLIGAQLKLVEYTPLQAIAFAYYRKHFAEKHAQAFQGFVLLTVEPQITGILILSQAIVHLCLTERDFQRSFLVRKNVI